MDIGPVMKKAEKKEEVQLRKDRGIQTEDLQATAALSLVNQIDAIIEAAETEL